MMKFVMADAETHVGCEELARALHDGIPVLLLDCRSFMDFNTSHIQNAHNVHCPPIVKRRSGGVLSLENIIRCGTTRRQLLAGVFSMVVVYDDSSAPTHLTSQPDSNMSLVLRCLTEDASIRHVRCLEDGFETFHSVMPHLCSDAPVLPPTSSVAAASGSPYQPSPLPKTPFFTVHPSSPFVMPSPIMTLTSAAMTSPIEASPTASSPMVTSSPATSRRTPTLCLPQVAISDEHLLQPPSHHSYTAATYSTPLRDQHCHLRLLLDQGDPVQILPWLYLGSVHHASQRARLKALGITALLNVSPIQSPHICDHFQYKTIPVADNQTSDLSCWFPEAIDFIECVRGSEGKVLVHCQAGVSRSATICIAYLMYHRRLSMEEAFDYLKSRRSVISPNINFMCQLLDYEAQLKLTSEREAAQQKKPTLKLTLTPLTPVGCNQEAGVFVFDSPCTPISPLAQSPIHHSPLVSPS